jgi:hypothetical protein
MSLEAKLNEIRSLLAQRDEIDRQLEGIIGNYGSRPTESEQQTVSAHADIPKTKPGHERKNKKGVPNKNRYDGDDARRNEGILAALANGEKPRHVAKQFGVQPSTVYNIKARSKADFAKAQRAKRRPSRRNARLQRRLTATNTTRCEMRCMTGISLAPNTHCRTSFPRAR